MKKVILLAVFSFFCVYGFADIKAVTENGDEVILYSDGTWKYAKDVKEKKKEEIKTNKTKFKKSPENKFLLKSKNVDVGVHLNTSKWTFKKSADTEDAEYEFQKKGGDLYGMLISEKLEIPLETLKEIALQNAKSVSPDCEITKQEYRYVNNTKVLMMQMVGTIQGIKFMYYGYYYSSPSGTVQFLTYTGQSLYSTYKKDIEDFLNGFTEVKRE